MLEKINELLEQKNFVELKKYLIIIEPEDIALLLNEIEEEKLAIVFRLLGKDEAAEVFAELDSDIQEKIINALSDKEIKEVIEELYLDDTVDLIEEMPSNIIKRILKNINKTDRKIINELLNYPEDSAGSIMTPEFVDLKENMTVAEAFEKIRKVGVDKETIYKCYVLSLKRKLLGVVDVKDMLFANEETPIKEIMKVNIIKVNTLDDQEEVAKKFDKYNEIALPVVDRESRLVGIITIDDAIDVMHEETEEDFEIMAAVTPSEESYFKTSIFKHAKNRFLWLLLLMISSTLSGWIITKYQNVYAAIPVLVSFIPMLMGTGGNCGSQSSTLVIRGLAMDEIEMKDFFRVIWKEIRVAIMVGIILALANGLRIVIQYKNLELAITIGITIILTVIISKLLGCTLPMIAKKLKLDPAVMAAPVISTIVDTCSVFTFFNVALLIMNI